MTEISTLVGQLEAHDVQVRELPAQLRATTTAAREFHGQAVPFDEEIELYPGIREKISTGAVQSWDRQLWWRHREPIGRLDGTAGATHWEIDAKISDTTLGRDAWTLVEDGVVDKLSIGFVPLEYTITEHREGNDTWTLITYTAIHVREVSIVPHPAYTNTTISNLREGHHMTTAPTTTPAPTEPATTSWASAADVQELSDSIEQLSRQVATLPGGASTEPTPAGSQWRSAGAILKAIVAGDEQARAEYDRAYTGATTADDVDAPTWAKDLTRLVEAASGIAAFFATEALPPEGMTVDGVQVKDNTVQVAKQVKEGDDLAYGKVTLAEKSWPVETFGGYTLLSRAMVERSRTNIVDKHLRALAIAAGKNKAARFRAFYKKIVDARVDAGKKISLAAGPAWKDWLLALVDAVDHFVDEGLALDALIVPKPIIQQFIGYTGADGRPMMTFDGSGSNTVGQLDLTTTKVGGKLAALDIIYNAKGDAKPAFVNREAIRSYESPLQRLQDGNIINLTEAFSVYHYAALADEFPAGILPVDIAAA